VIKKLLLLSLILFGFFYSYLLSFYAGGFVSLIFVLITIGFASTIYLLDKKINYRIIFYIWIAIIVVAILSLLLNWTFNIFSTRLLIRNS